MAERKPEQVFSGREGTQVLGRAIEVLRAVARIQRSGATLAAITRATGLSRSTAFRIVHFLAQERLLEHDEAHGSYYLGPLAFELGLAARGQADLIARWQDRVEQVSRKTGMTAYLVARSDSEVVCLAAVDAPSILRAVSLVVGQRLPLGVGAGSLAILSSLEDEEVRSLLALNKEKLRMHGHGKLTPDMLWQRIAATRANGFAYSEDTVARGVCGVGIMVPGDEQLTQLALSVSAPASDMDADRQRDIARLLQQAVQA